MSSSSYVNLGYKRFIENQKRITDLAAGSFPIGRLHPSCLYSQHALSQQTTYPYVSSVLSNLSEKSVSALVASMNYVVPQLPYVHPEGADKDRPRNSLSDSLNTEDSFPSLSRADSSTSLDSLPSLSRVGSSTSLASSTALSRVGSSTSLASYTAFSPVGSSNSLASSPALSRMNSSTSLASSTALSRMGSSNSLASSTTLSRVGSSISFTSSAALSRVSSSISSASSTAFSRAGSSTSLSQEKKKDPKNSKLKKITSFFHSKRKKHQNTESIVFESEEKPSNPSFFTLKFSHGATFDASYTPEMLFFLYRQHPSKLPQTITITNPESIILSVALASKKTVHSTGVMMRLFPKSQFALVDGEPPTTLCIDNPLKLLNLHRDHFSYADFSRINPQQVIMGFNLYHNDRQQSIESAQRIIAGNSESYSLWKFEEENTDEERAHTFMSHFSNQRKVRLTEEKWIKENRRILRELYNGSSAHSSIPAEQIPLQYRPYFTRFIETYSEESTHCLRAFTKSTSQSLFVHNPIILIEECLHLFGTVSYLSSLVAAHLLEPIDAAYLSDIILDQIKQKTLEALLNPGLNVLELNNDTKNPIQLTFGEDKNAQRKRKIVIASCVFLHYLSTRKITVDLFDCLQNRSQQPWNPEKDLCFFGEEKHFPFFLSLSQETTSFTIDFYLRHPSYGPLIAHAPFFLLAFPPPFLPYSLPAENLRKCVPYDFPTSNMMPLKVRNIIRRTSLTSVSDDLFINLFKMLETSYPIVCTHWNKKNYTETRNTLLLCTNDPQIPQSRFLERVKGLIKITDSLSEKPGILVDQITIVLKEWEQIHECMYLAQAHIIVPLYAFAVHVACRLFYHLICVRFLQIQHKDLSSPPILAPILMDFDFKKFLANHHQSPDEKALEKRWNPLLEFINNFRIPFIQKIKKHDHSEKTSLSHCIPTVLENPQNLHIPENSSELKHLQECLLLSIQFMSCIEIAKIALVHEILALFYQKIKSDSLPPRTHDSILTVATSYLKKKMIQGTRDEEQSQMSTNFPDYLQSSVEVLLAKTRSLCVYSQIHHQNRMLQQPHHDEPDHLTLMMDTMNTFFKLVQALNTKP